MFAHWVGDTSHRARYTIRKGQLQVRLQHFATRVASSGLSSVLRSRLRIPQQLLAILDEVYSSALNVEDGAPN